jgi:hypothetical protein
MIAWFQLSHLLNDNCCSIYRVDQKEEQLQFGLGTIQAFVQLVEMAASYWDAAALAIVAGTLARIVAGMMLLAEWLAFFEQGESFVAQKR